MTDFLILPLILIVVGTIALILWMLIVLASGLFLIGLACATLFTEIYGFYLLFTETELYTEDLAQNGLFVLRLSLSSLILLCLSWQAGQDISGR